MFTGFLSKSSSSAGRFLTFWQSIRVRAKLSKKRASKSVHGIPLEEQLIRSTFLDILAIYRGPPQAVKKACVQKCSRGSSRRAAHPLDVSRHSNLSCLKGVRPKVFTGFLSKSNSSARRFSTFWLSIGVQTKLSKRRGAKSVHGTPLEEQLIRSTFLGILAIYRGPT